MSKKNKKMNLIKMEKETRANQPLLLNFYSTTVRAFIHHPDLQSEDYINDTASILEGGDLTGELMRYEGTPLFVFTWRQGIESVQLVQKSIDCIEVLYCINNRVIGSSVKNT